MHIRTHAYPHARANTRALAGTLAQFERGGGGRRDVKPIGFCMSKPNFVIIFFEF